MTESCSDPRSCEPASSAPVQRPDRASIRDSHLNQLAHSAIAGNRAPDGHRRGRLGRVALRRAGVGARGRFRDEVREQHRPRYAEKAPKKRRVRLCSKLRCMHSHSTRAKQRCARHSCSWATQPLSSKRAGHEDPRIGEIDCERAPIRRPSTPRLSAYIHCLEECRLGTTNSLPTLSYAYDAAA